MNMNLITMRFEIPFENQAPYIKTLGSFQECWSEKGFVVSLFREKGDPDRFLQFFLSERSIDEITELLLNDPEMKKLFMKLKEGDGRVVVSVFEQVL